MSNSQTIYPAMIAGYFHDPAAAAAAAEELQTLDTGALDGRFDRINILRLDDAVVPEERISTLNSWMSRLFGREAPAKVAVIRAPSVSVVMVRGAISELTSLVEPLLHRQGAHDIKHYRSWDPGNSDERTTSGVQEQSLKDLLANAGLQ